MVLLDVSFWSKHFNPMMWNYQTENHLSVDVLGTSDVAFHEIWFVLLLHKHPAIVDLLIRECQYTFFVLRCTAHCSRKIYPRQSTTLMPTQSQTPEKIQGNAGEVHKNLWHQHRGAADQALPSTTPSTLDDFQPCPMNSWCLSVVFVVICWIFENSLLISNSLSIWCLILRASCYHSECSPKFLAFWAGRGWVHLQNVAHIDTSTRKLTEILNC